MKVDVRCAELKNKHLIEVSKSRLEKLGRYFSSEIEVHVKFAQIKSRYMCTIIIDDHNTTYNHFNIRSNYIADEPITALNSAATRLESQLRKYKRMVKDRHLHKHVQPSKEYAIFPLPEYNWMSEVDNVEMEYDAQIDNLIRTDPKIIHEEQGAHILTLSVMQAVMRMDLCHLPAVMFKNVQNGRLNMVYYKADGNIGWVDPAE